MEIQRFLPAKDEMRLYSSFIRNELSGTILDENTYLQVVKKYEVQMEYYIKDVLANLGVYSTVKTERYSLLFEKEIVCSQMRDGLNYNAFDLQRFIRQVVLELLELKVKKLRFYVTGDLILEKNDSIFKSSNLVIVKFRYSIHDQFES